MDEYVSNSEEDEEHIITPLLVSKEKLFNFLSRLPSQDKNKVCHDLKKTRFSSLLASDYTADHLDMLKNTKGKRISSETNIPDIAEDSVAGTNDNAHTDRQSTFSMDSIEEEKENASHFASYLNSERNRATRRGLRKRNFASTHPYLADQAHWLGLCSVDFLNEIYRENPDINIIVKLLNQNYMNCKRKYPKEEKYKAKNFYSYLGAKTNTKAPTDDNPESSQPADAYNPSLHESEDNAKNHSSQISYQDSESDIPLNPKRKGHVILQDDDEEDPYSGEENYSMSEIGDHFNRSISFSESPSEVLSDVQDSERNSSDEEEDMTKADSYIRVGGKVLKERSALRGVLPESAKLLDIYQKKTLPSKNKRQEKRIVTQPSKGYAKRKASKTNGQNDYYRELKSFVDDDYRESGIQDPEWYRNFNRQITPDIDEVSFISKNNDDNINETETIPDFTDISDLSQESLSPIYKPNFDSVESRYKTAHTQESSDKGHDFYEVNHDDDLYGLAEEHDYFDAQLSRRPYKSRSRQNTRPRHSITNDVTPRFRQSGGRKQHVHNPRRMQGRLTYERNRNLLDLLPSDRLQPGRIRRKKSNNPKGIRKNRERHLDDKQVKLRNERSAKSVLGMDYYFLRDPVPFTTDIEIENEKASKKRDLLKYSTGNFTNMDPSLGAFNYQNSLLNEINFEKIHDLDKGMINIIAEDSLHIQAVGKRYFLLLVNKSESHSSLEKILIKLLKKIDDKYLKTNDLLDIHGSLRGVVKWLLMLQEDPGEHVRHLVLQLSNSISFHKSDGYSILAINSLVTLIYYICQKLAERSTTSTILVLLRSNFDKVCRTFWCLFFKVFTLESYTNMEQYKKDIFSESMRLMYLLLSNQKGSWWMSINNALKVVHIEKGNEYQVCEAYAYLLSLVPRKEYNWSPFYVLYERFSHATDLTVHILLIEMVYALNLKLEWPIEEKLLLTIYSSITSRKFANFDDEMTRPNLIDQFNTRDTLPQNTFFERFLHLLYCFFSSLPLEFNRKRLVSKLFTSSRYTYQKDRKSQIMFANRLNFINLLSYLSDVDLGYQVTDLIKQIISTNDSALYELSIKGLIIFSQIAFKKTHTIPLEPYSIIVDEISNIYLYSADSLKLWKLFLTHLSDFFPSGIRSGYDLARHINFIDFINLINFSKLPDLMALQMTDQLNQCIYNIMSLKDLKLDLQDMNVLGKAGIRIYYYLHSQMCRFPLLKQSQEDKIILTVENCIKVWIRCNQITKDHSWNLIAFQKYPYIGNAKLRDQFSLFFYNELIAFSDLRNYFDDIIKVILKHLAYFSTSLYLPQILNLLKSSTLLIFHFKKEYVPSQFTFLQISNFKLLILGNFIQNISSSLELSSTSKTHYFELLLKTLNEEYSTYFLSKGYSEFCKSSIKYLQKYARSEILDLRDFESLTRKLGIRKIELNEYNWQGLSLKDKLITINNELVSYVHFERDVFPILDKLIPSEDFDLIFHLVSVYFGMITINKKEKWNYISVLLEYTTKRLGEFRINIPHTSFKKFITMLVDMTYFHPYKKEISSRTAYYHRVKAFSYMALILRLTLMYFDGFKDQSFIINAIKEYSDILQSIRDDQRNIPAEFRLFSSFKLYHIQQHGSEPHIHEQTNIDDTEVSDAWSQLKYNYEHLLLISYNYSYDLNEKTEYLLPVEMNF